MSARHLRHTDDQDITCNEYVCMSVQHRSVARVRRNTATPADILRLMKQPTGIARSVVRAADYMENSIKLIQKRSLSTHHIQKRSINATGMSFHCFHLSIHSVCCSDTAQLLILCLCESDLISEEDLKVIAELTGCSARDPAPSCKTTSNLDKFRTATSVCNNRWGSLQADLLLMYEPAPTGLEWNLTRTFPPLSSLLSFTTA